MGDAMGDVRRRDAENAEGLCIVKSKLIDYLGDLSADPAAQLGKIMRCVY